MLESMVEWMSFPLYYALDGAPPPPRLGAAHATIYPYGPFPCGDGKTVMLGLQNEREWQVFCTQVLEQPALATDARFASNPLRVQAREALRAIIVQAFAPYTAEQIAQRLDAAQIANAQARTMQDVWAHPQLAARRRWTQIGSSAGPLPAMLPPAIPADWQPRMDAVPALGAQTDAILGEAGYAAADIAALRAAGVV
jgi:itaconate CoA-transferase